MLPVDVLVDAQDPGNPTESKRRDDDWGTCFVAQPPGLDFGISFLILLEPVRG